MLPSATVFPFLFLLLVGFLDKENIACDDTTFVYSIVSETYGRVRWLLSNIP